jgi:iron complex outermembrane receptor protein
MPMLNNRRARLGLLAGSALVGLAAPGLALAAAPSDANQVQEIVVTAQRRSENIQQVPVTVQAFTAKTISDLGIKSSADLGQVTPNVDIAMPAGAGNQPIITIRGIGLNDYDTNNAGPNGIYVDEVYLSSPASQTFQTFDLQRIEVLKGPQGTLYGRNTSGGAINFVGVKPTDTPEADFHLEYSSYNTFNFEGGAGGPIAPDLDARIGLVVNQSQGYGYNELTHNHEDGANNAAGRFQLLWKPTDKVKVLWNLHGGYVNNRPTEYRHIGDLLPGTQYNAVPTKCSVAAAYAGDCVDLFGYGTPSGFYDGAYNRQQHLKVNSFGSYLRVDADLGYLDLTSITAFEHDDKIHPEDSDASPNQLLEINFGVRSNTITQELRASHSEQKYDWVAGLYYLYEDLHQNQPINILLDGDKFFGPGGCDAVFADNPPTIYDLEHPISTCAERAFDYSHQTTNAYAAFGQGDYFITDNLKLTLGGRLTSENRSFSYLGSVEYQYGGMGNYTPLVQLADTNEGFNDTNFSWRTGLDYHFTHSVHAYASVATGYKSGDFNGSFLSNVPEEITLQLKPVLPETVTSYEVGIKSELFDNRLIFNLSAFYNDYRKMQVFVLVPPVAGGSGLPVNVLDNAQRAHTEGIDAEMIARPISNLTATFNLGLLDTRLDTFIANVDPSQPNYSGDQLPLAPHFSFATLIDYKVPVGQGDLDFQFSANYRSHQFFDISNDPYITQTGYWLENVRVAYQFPGDKWEVAAFVRNLSGQKYLLDAFDLTSPFGFIQGIEGAPRFIGGEINFRY